MTMRAILLLSLFLSASAFVPQHPNSFPTQLLAFRDQVMPENVRSKRSKKIRDKLLGDMESRFEPKGDCPLIAEQKRKDRENKKRKKEQEHPLLTQMMRLFEQHVAEMERIDPNA
jgi:hypothetical protein